MFEGKVWRYGDNIDTDVIIPARYLNTFEPKALAEHCMEDIDTTFAKEVVAGDIMVGGRNFGCGSSREQAPEVVKALGVRAVIAKSFARIFFRNAINNGLLLIECRDLPDEVSEGDTLTVTVGEKIRANGKDYKIAALPENLMEILNAGGLVKAMRKRNGLN